MTQTWLSPAEVVWFGRARGKKAERERRQLAPPLILEEIMGGCCQRLAHSHKSLYSTNGMYPMGMWPNLRPRNNSLAFFRVIETIPSRLVYAIFPKLVGFLIMGHGQSFNIHKFHIPISWPVYVLDVHPRHRNWIRTYKNHVLISQIVLMPADIN